jgi:hypothetical protein
MTLDQDLLQALETQLQSDAPGEFDPDLFDKDKTQLGDFYSGDEIARPRNIANALQHAFDPVLRKWDEAMSFNSWNSFAKGISADTTATDAITHLKWFTTPIQHFN